MKTTLVLISLALAGAAQAANCPRGQIYRVSKHACVDRGEAVKLGIVHGAANAAKPAPEADAPGDKAEPAPEAADAEPAAKAPSEPDAPLRPRQVRAVKIAPAPAAPSETPLPPPANALGQDSRGRDSLTQFPSAISAPPPAAAAPEQTEAAQAKTSPFGALDTGNVPAMSPAK